MLCHWDRDQRVSVTKVAVHMGGEGDGGVNSVQGHIQLASESGMRAGMHRATAEQAKKH